jgi:hypothetical protein
VQIFEDGRHLTIVNADGSGTRDLVQHPVGGDFYPFFPAAWSPDGSTIAEFCQSQNDWQVRDICGVDVATGDLHDWVREYGLIDPEDRNEWGEAPAFTFGGWDPSGTRVSYVVTSEDSHGSRSHLEVLDLQTRAHTAIVDAVDGGVFTADGQSLLYRTSSSSPLYRTSLDGGSPAVVPGVTVTPIERSPDGEWYLGAEDLHWQLFNLDGEVRQVTDADGLIRISW